MCQLSIAAYAEAFHTRCGVGILNSEKKFAWRSAAVSASASAATATAPAVWRRACLAGCGISAASDSDYQQCAIDEEKYPSCFHFRPTPEACHMQAIESDQGEKRFC